MLPASCLDLSRAVKEAKDASKGTVKTERKLEEKVRKGERWGRGGKEQYKFIAH